MPEAIEDDLGKAEENTFVHLSDLFKYISHFRRGGHQIGRKVGDMLEVLTYAGLYRNKSLRRALILEPRIFGFFGAGHKVEFGLFNCDESGSPIEKMSEMFGFIECKKVGVEQTINSTFKKTYLAQDYLIPYGAKIPISLNPRWAERARYEIEFSRMDGSSNIAITKNGEPLHFSEVESGHRYMVGLTVSGKSFFVEQERSLRDIDESIRACKILKVADVRPDGVKCVVEDCLPGPQTPEKAKQASFVALDVRKGLFGQFDKRDDEVECPSVLVLTEFSHWEPKSINMIKGSLDYNLVVEDAVVIEAMTAYENTFGDGFLDRITKEAFRKNEDVRALTLDILNSHDGRIFRDIADGKQKAFSFGDNRLLIS